MHDNYKLDEQAITNIIKRHIKPIEKQRLIKLIIYYTKFKTSNPIVKNNTNSAKTLINQTNVVYRFIRPFQVCLPKNKNHFRLVIQLLHYIVVLLITFLKIAP